MKLAACLTLWPGEWSSLKALMEKLPAAVLMEDSAGELLQSLGSVEADLFLVDGRMPQADMDMLLDLVVPTSTIVVVLPALLPGEEAAVEIEEQPGIYDFLRLSDRPSTQKRVLLRAMERTSLLQSENTGASGRQAAGEQGWPMSSSPPPASRPWEMALRSLARALSAGFHQQELMEAFLDLSVALAGVARAAILLLDPATSTFTVSASHGLYGPMIKLYPHPRRGGLADWLKVEGRPLWRDDPSLRPSRNAREIQRSLDVLQATVCIPVASGGEMLAILALGSHLDGTAPTRDDVEILFSMGAHVAAALQNIRAHREMEARKTEYEALLDSMPYGVAAINGAGEVTLFNRRAAEILKRSPADMIGRDLRLLPAPLGDILFGSLKTGEASHLANITLYGLHTTAEVHSYPLLQIASNQPAGSVLVLQDISERLSLEESHRQADRREIFNRLVSQLAHEIKNPMTAIKTFADLFTQQSEDGDFRTFVEVTVLSEILRLEEVLGKLVDLVDQNPPHLEDCNWKAILQEAAARLDIEASSAGVRLAVELPEDLAQIQADPARISRAFFYLLHHLVTTTSAAGGGEVKLTASAPKGLPSRIILEVSSSAPWIEPGDASHLFDPLFVRRERLNLSLPVAFKIIQEHHGHTEAIVTGGRVHLQITLPANPRGGEFGY